MKRVWKKRRRLHEVLDERSTEAVNGDGGRYRRARVPGLAVAHHLMARGWQVRWLYRRSYGSGFSAEAWHRYC